MKRDMPVYITTVSTPVGVATLASDGEKLCGLWLANQKYFGEMGKSSFNAQLLGAVKDDLPIFDRARNWLKRYFSGENPAIGEVPLALTGSDFRTRVWHALCNIPYGQTITYGEIAARVGCISARAAGGAVGHNPISIIVPCHRVVGTDGKLTGFAGGLDVKARLLELERSVVS